MLFFVTSLVYKKAPQMRSLLLLKVLVINEIHIAWVDVVIKRIFPFDCFLQSFNPHVHEDCQTDSIKEPWKDSGSKYVNQDNSANYWKKKYLFTAQVHHLFRLHHIVRCSKVSRCSLDIQQHGLLFPLFCTFCILYLSEDR